MIVIDKNGKQWQWPSDDKKLVQVMDWIEDIDYIMQFVDKTGLCVQAGGACGQWPARFAELFDQVVTFEPHIVNYRYLKENIENIENITSYNLALGDEEKKVSMKLDAEEANNSGAYYTVEGVDVLQVKLDLFGLKPDLIQLDVEGAERSVLKGAVETLKHKPVVVIEEKPLYHHADYLDARRYLEYLGYKEVGKIHRDVVFKC